MKRCANGVQLVDTCNQRRRKTMKGEKGDEAKNLHKDNPAREKKMSHAICGMFAKRNDNETKRESENESESEGKRQAEMEERSGRSEKYNARWSLHKHHRHLTPLIISI